MAAEIYLVGLGGAGTSIIKSIFEENDGKIPLRGLVVDIDHTKLDDLNIEGLATLPLAYEKGFNAQMGELYNLELHLDNPKIIPPRVSFNQCVSKNRRYSRAIFNYNIYKKQLPAQEILDRFGQDFAKDTSAKCMLIISSLGGGTGSAILLEVANYIRSILIKRSSQTPVFGIGIMGAKQDVSTYCKAATYATLLELNKSMQECSLDDRAFDGFMLLDLDQVISRMSGQQSHPIEHAQLELTTAVRCFVNDFLGYQTNYKNRVNQGESNTDVNTSVQIDFNDFRGVLCSNRSNKNFTFCTMNVDYTEFPVNIDTIIKSIDDRVLNDMISNTATPAKYIDLLLHDYYISNVLVAFGMKANPSLNDFKSRISRGVSIILAPYATDNAKIQTYPYTINDEFSIYGYAFFNNISLSNIYSFKKYANEYEDYFKENPDIHAYDIEYWENKIETTDLE